MAGLIAKPPKLLLVHHPDDDSSTDTDSDDDLSLCDLPIRAPSAPSFAVSSPPAAKEAARSGSNSNRRAVSVSVDKASRRVDDDEDNDPFEFFGSRHGSGMCSPSAVFSGGRMFPTQQAPESTYHSTAFALLATAANANSSSTHAYSGLPPVPMPRRSRSEAVRRPPRDAAAYNRSASLEGRGRARRAGLGGAGKKGDYRRLPPLQQGAPPAASSPFGSSASHKKTSGSGGGTTCSIDAVPSCGPRPKWYVFATFATVKPPQGEMDIKGIRTRQRKRNTQQQPADGVISGGGALPTISRLASEARRGRKSWLLNSLSCRVDVDTLVWSPSDPPMPLP